MTRYVQAFACLITLSGLQACATMPQSTEIQICEQTPEGPAKMSCVKHLLPNVRGVMLSSTNTNPFWSNLYIKWSDYLGLRDEDYRRAREIQEVLHSGEQIRRQHRDTPDDGFFAMAGYFNSLGSKWAGFSNSARATGESCISRVGGCQAVDQ